MGVTGVMLLSRYMSHVVPKTTFTASNRMTQQSKRRLVCVSAVFAETRVMFTPRLEILYF